MLISQSTSDVIKASIVPAGSGSNVWCIYSQAGNAFSRKYDGTWSNQTSLNISGGSQAPTENSPPSVVVDGRGVVHVVCGTGRSAGQDSIPTIEYVRNETNSKFFTNPVNLDAYIPGGVGDYYPTISLDSSTNNLYVFWLRSDATLVGKTIMGVKCVSGTWSNLTLGSQTTYAKRCLTSIYSAPGEWLICWQWTQNTSSPIEVMYDSLIPEFSGILPPVTFIIAIVAVSARRARSRRNRAI